VEGLLERGADLTVISPDFHPDLIQLSKEKAIQLIRRDYQPGDLENARMAIVATNHSKKNRQIAQEARKQGILVNVADDPEGSDFILPSFFQRGKLTFAISTGGASPALSKKIRIELEKKFGEEFSGLVNLVEEVRSSLRSRKIHASPEIWQEALDLDKLIILIQTGQMDEARTFLLGRLGVPPKLKKRTWANRSSRLRKAKIDEN
jgi:precorrin-2 dehydrogenase/sirohydrochlorin ferrochelatase